MATNSSTAIQTRSSSIYQMAGEVVEKARQAARIGMRKEVVTEVRRALQTIEKYDFNRYAAELSRFLMYYHYYYANDKYRAEKYEAKRKHHAFLANIEEELEAQYAKITYQLKATSSPKQKVKEELQSLCEKILPYLSYRNASINTYVYSLLVVNAHIRNELTLCVQYCQEAIRFMREKKIDRSLYFYYYLVPTMIELQQFDEAEAAIVQALQSIRRGSPNHARYNIYNITLALHAGNYRRAYDLYQQVGRIQDKTIAERYKIIKGYLSWLIKAGYIEGVEENSFKLGKFLNDVPIFEKDKAGNNINILVLQFLHRFNKYHGRIIDQMDTIHMYRSRHLRGRYNLFLKLLLKIPAYRFKLPAIRLRTEKDFQELKKHRMNVDIELVPFDRLWEMVLGYLERKT